MLDEFRRNIVGAAGKKEMTRTDSSMLMLGQKVDYEGKEYKNRIVFHEKTKASLLSACSAVKLSNSFQFWNCRLLFLRIGFEGIL